jgi:RNA polymerase sigma-70 factor (ECF subfamily)
MVTDNRAPPTDALHAAHEAGIAAWPGVDLSLDAFARHVETLPVEGGAAEVLARHGEDLFLACACALGIPRAVELFSRHYLGAVNAMVGHMLPRALLEDLVQSLHEQMLVRRGTTPPGIAAYRGTGPLAAWVRITATRAAVRTRKRAARFADETLVDGRHELSGTGPETLFLRRQYGPALHAATLEAIAALPERPRELLRNYYVDGLTIDELAERDGIHRATAARRIQSARMLVLAHVRERAAVRLGIPAEDIDSVIRLVASQLEISLGVLQSRGHWP